MKGHMTLVFFFITLAASTAVAGSAGSSAAPSYTWVFLETGPTSREGLSEEELGRMQAAHLENLTRLGREGKNLLAGPLGRESASIRGIVIMDMPSLDDIRREFAIDPYIAGGYLSIRAHEWRMSTGRIGVPAEPPELGEYLIALVERRPAGSAVSGRIQYERLEKALVSEAPETVALAGPVSGDGSLCGIVLFRSDDGVAIRRMLDRSIGDLDYDLYPQYLLKGQID